MTHAGLHKEQRMDANLWIELLVALVRIFAAGLAG